MKTREEAERTARETIRIKEQIPTEDAEFRKWCKHHKARVTGTATAYWPKIMDDIQAGDWIVCFQGQPIAVI